MRARHVGRALALAFSGITAIGAAALSLAAVAPDRDRSGDVRVAGLDARERAALDITRLETFEFGDALVATVTVRGSIAALGRGHLTGAGIALMLHRFTETPSVIVRSFGRGPRLALAGEGAPVMVIPGPRAVTFFLRRTDDGTHISLRTVSRLRGAGREAACIRKTARDDSGDYEYDDDEDPWNDETSCGPGDVAGAEFDGDRPSRGTRSCAGLAADTRRLSTRLLPAMRAYSRSLRGPALRAESTMARDALRYVQTQLAALRAETAKRC